MENEMFSSVTIKSGKMVHMHRKKQIAESKLVWELYQSDIFFMCITKEETRS